MSLYSKSFQLTIIAGIMTGLAFPQTGSRLAEIAAQQEQKAAQAKPDEPGKIEHSMIWFRDHALLERVSEGAGGLRPKLGGLGAGTGFGIGPEYHRTRLLDGNLDFRASAQTSFRGDHRFEFDVAAPKISNGRYFAEFYA